jgi:hypothetical protein
VILYRIIPVPFSLSLDMFFIVVLVNPRCNTSAASALVSMRRAVEDFPAAVCEIVGGSLRCVFDFKGILWGKM